MARNDKPPRWAWCPTCEAWIGAVPPMLPPYWSLDKAAAMHERGSSHRVERVTMAQLLGWHCRACDRDYPLPVVSHAIYHEARP